MPLLLKIAGIARSTYYYHLSKLERADRHQDLKAEIVSIFRASKSRYGYRRVRRTLVRQGWTVSWKLVAKLMRQMGLRSKTRRKKNYSSFRGNTSNTAPNVLERKFATDAPNQKWVSDITMFQLNGNKLYLSPVIDLFDHSVVSFTIGTAPTTRLSSESLRKAFKNAGHPENVLVHTDQGFHYHHISWISQLKSHRCVQSMSRKGNCYDNSVAENFFTHLKQEMFVGEKFAKIADLTRAIKTYILWYNDERTQERLGGITPHELRQDALDRAA